MDKSVANSRCRQNGPMVLQLFFQEKNNYNVSLYDKRKFSLDINLDLKVKGHRITACKTLDQCVRNADIVIICVPIKTTVSVINKCDQNNEKRSLYCRDNFIKTDIFKSLLKFRIR
jgi:prephenate dehydrogenase